jgi:predicted nucleic acid-binding protein
MTESNKSPVGIDTNILIYATRSQSQLLAITDVAKRDECRKLSRYAIRLIDRLRNEEKPILLSTISLGEYLVKVKASDHSRVTKELESLFSIVGYSQKAASKAAEMAACTSLPKRAAREQGDRMVVAADTKIMASLIAAGATTIYLNDKRACQLGKQFVNTCMLPLVPTDLTELIEEKDEVGS